MIKPGQGGGGRKTIEGASTTATLGRLYPFHVFCLRCPSLNAFNIHQLVRVITLVSHGMSYASRTQRERKRTEEAESGTHDVQISGERKLMTLRRQRFLCGGAKGKGILWQARALTFRGILNTLVCFELFVSKEAP